MFRQTPGGQISLWKSHARMLSPFLIRFGALFSVQSSWARESCLETLSVGSTGGCVLKWGFTPGLGGCQNSHLVSPKAFTPSLRPPLLLAALVHLCAVKGEEGAKGSAVGRPQVGPKRPGRRCLGPGRDCGWCPVPSQGQLLLQKAGSMGGLVLNVCGRPFLPFTHCE